MTYGNRNPRPQPASSNYFTVEVVPALSHAGIDIFSFDVRFAVAEYEGGSAEDKMRDLAATLEDAGWTTQARQVSDAADAFDWQSEFAVV